MHKRISELPRNKRRGSFPRCILLTEGADAVVAKRIAKLIDPHGTVTAEHVWMPRGFDQASEAQIGKSKYFLSAEQRSSLKDWWLVHRRGAAVPNWDLACTAAIQGREGLVLVEAKAHSSELKADGKNLRGKDNPDNHKQISAAIAEARTGLNSLMPGWNISVDSHYQLSNRFAWAWKIASLGVPVILVYLGFLDAKEMATKQDNLFASANDWEQAVKDHGAGIVPDKAWTKKLEIDGAPLISLIRSKKVAL